jgi:hypothetical protein
MSIKPHKRRYRLGEEKETHAQKGDGRITVQNGTTERTSRLMSDRLRSRESSPAALKINDRSDE